LKAYTPGLDIPAVYNDMSKQIHLLIAGKTGSGKSVVINGIIYSLLSQYFPEECKFVLVDPKRVELSSYKKLPHCLYYASEKNQIEKAFTITMQEIENRYKIMQRHGQRKYTAGQIYLIIDELADLILTNKKIVLPYLQRIAQIGRAAGIHIIAATQCPLTQVIPTEIKVNFDSIVGLKTATKQHSRNIINIPGCENLPPYGEGYYITPRTFTREKLPLIPDEQINKIIQHWTT